MKKTKSLSRYGRNAASLLGSLIRSQRLQQGHTAAEVAERAGISRELLRRIETGDPGVSLAAAFEAATVVGVPLFEDDPSRLAMEVETSRKMLRLLPSSARLRQKAVKDDF
ncbi:MAG: helix-turn-helix transcriptional regulator [Devosia sp.]|nr:helix-turn-helix transcriptional regulator [Devosia sp.]